MKTQLPSEQKFAVATDHGHLSRHFRTTHAFAVFHYSRSGRPSALYRVNTRPEAHGSHAAEAHHREIVELLADCSVLICGGIGDHAAALLEAHGIRVVVAATTGSPEVIYRSFRKGSLPLGTVHACCHGGY